MTATFTADFRHEFESERADWIRKRIAWYTGVVAALTLFVLSMRLTSYGMGWLGQIDQKQFFGEVVGRAIIVSMFTGAFFYVRTRAQALNRDALLNLVFWIIIAAGLISGLQAPVMAMVMEDTTGAANLGVGAGWLFALFINHFVAALFIPWTPREALRPMVPLMSLYSILSLATAITGAEGWIIAITVAVVSWSIVFPGLVVAWLRHSRYRDRFHYKMLRGRYGEMKRELVDARRIHESLFPETITDGPVRFDYRYEPMRQIGGDFLFSQRFPGFGLDDDPPEPLSIVIIDVTGHGIPAALTVNRLHGELERVFAEEPDVAPGEVLRSLNRYVSLTLARHSVYATALCLRIDPAGDEVQWASAGHPPAFLRAIDGRIEEVHSTTFVLGAVEGADFEPDERALSFAAGDTLIAYTDGAIEATNHDGAMLRVEGLRRIIAGARPDAGPGGGWASAVLRAVDFHRAGPPADDTLIVELFRPLRDDSRAARRANRSKQTDAQATGVAESSSTVTSADPSV